MLKVLKQKLLACGYITNASTDKHARYEIGTILEENINAYGENVMLLAIQRFVEIWEERKGKKVMKKVPYFKKLLEETLNEALAPDEDFPEIEINEELIRATIIKIIESAVITVQDAKAFNPLKEKWSKSPFYDVPEELYQKAYETMRNFDYYFSPIIERALKLNDGFEGSMKDELEAIYKELDSFTEDAAYEAFKAQYMPHLGGNLNNKK